MYKALIFDLDGTLTEPRQNISSDMINILQRLQEKYLIIILGAGNCKRIYEQMNYLSYIWIFGNYGLEAYYADNKGLQKEYKQYKSMNLLRIVNAINAIRIKYNLTVFKGDSFELHSTGMITFALLGTKADIKDKLLFDPDKSKRKKILKNLKIILSDYNILIGGTSSFDILPQLFDKGKGIELICEKLHLEKKDILFFGDAIKKYENDDGIQTSGVNYIEIKNPTKLKEVLREYIS